MIAAAALLLGSGQVPLVLDASAPRRPACAADGDSIVVCATREASGTLLPIRYNGETGWLRIDPGGPHSPACNLAFITRAKIVGRGPLSFGHVGPVELRGGSTEIALRLNDAVWRTKVWWSGRDAVDGADCIVGPDGLGVPAVTFRLGRTAPGMRTAVLPILRQGPSRGDIRLEIGGKMIPVRFDLQREETVLTAPAARVLAPILVGTVEGPVTFPTIMWSVRRPVRRFVVKRPLQIGPLVVAAPFTRVRDYGDALHVRSVDPAEDVDAIKVSATRDADTGFTLIRVGSADLARCADITFDIRAGEVRLTC